MHQLSPMAFERTISFWLNAVACLAFAAALVLFPPSASHAASGMHDGHYAAVMDDVADITAQDALHDALDQPALELTALLQNLLPPLADGAVGRLHAVIFNFHDRLDVLVQRARDGAQKVVQPVR